MRTIDDLSSRHCLAGNLFDSPSSRDDWERYRLREDQVEFFHEYGYRTTPLAHLTTVFSFLFHPAAPSWRSE
jgi:hypothetical protein